METLNPSYLVVGDGTNPSNHYRIVDESVEFSPDGEHWRRLSFTDLMLHVELSTPLAPWLKSRLGSKLSPEPGPRGNKARRRHAA
jgi:hypothetical protein